MKLKEKLKGAKEAIKDYSQEMIDVTNLSAEEYAQYYGGNYTNFLKAVNTKIFKALSEYNSEGKEPEEKPEVSIEMKINSYKKSQITFNEPEYLGAKETLDISKINFMLTKAKMSSYIDEERNVLVVNSKSSASIFEEARDEYIGKVTSILENTSKTISAQAESIKKSAGATIKRTLKDASDWADKNL